MNKRGLIWIIILFVFILLLAIAAFLIYYFILPRAVAKEEIEVVSCNDSDGKDIYTPVISSYVYFDSVDNEDSQVTSPDWCEYNFYDAKPGVGLVREGVCKDNKFISLYMTCGMGRVCRQGRCIKGDETMAKCYDSDGGKVTGVKGGLIAEGSGEDYCVSTMPGVSPTTERYTTSECSGDNCYVEEFYCENDMKQSQVIACPNGCKEGVCL